MATQQAAMARRRLVSGDPLATGGVLSGVMFLVTSLVSTSGCIGVSQKRATAGVVGGSVADLNVCRAGTRPDADGPIDDFEDGNSQLTVQAGRDGYWWTKQDDKGSTVEPKPFAPTAGGADGSEMAMRAWGTTVTGTDAWGGGFGVNLVARGVTYDASRHAGLSFKARVGGGGSGGPTSYRQLRLKVGDVNTHKDGGVCKSCWNHFGKDLTLTPQWKEYRVLFTDLRQEPYWGDPRPAALTPGRLVSVDWSIGPGQTFDVWIDDLTFLDCK